MNVGDYVRYVDVFNNTIKIRKINEIIPPDKLIKKDVYFFNNKECSLKENIIKSSPNIIDLMEKNDLVIDNYGNIYVVDYVFDNYVYTTTKQGNIIKTLCDYQIKSIVTKECFKSMEYKVGD